MESFDYFVQSAGVRSPVFRIDAAELPFVERMEMEFVYPAYTGLGPRTIDHGGDIAVLRGTTVRLRVHSTMATKAGPHRARRDASTVPLTVNADGTLSGSFQVKDDGIYRIDLASPAGTLVTRVAAVHHRRADRRGAVGGVLEARPRPARDEPGRDLRRGRRRRRLRREAARPGVRGERRAREAGEAASGPAPSPRAEVSAGHTFFLEELGLQPGDVVSYYARATDNDDGQRARRP